MEWLMDYWIQQGVSRFVLSVGYMSEAFINHFGAEYRHVPIDYSIEDQPLGTGGGLIQGLTLVDKDRPLLVLNGDTFFETNLSHILAFAEHHQSDWCMSLSESQNTERYMGITLSKDNKITSLNAQSASHSDLPSTDDILSRHCLINAGVYLVKPSCLTTGAYPSDTAISLETQILPDALANNKRIFGMKCQGCFIDIGTPQDYDRAASTLAQVIS